MSEHDEQARRDAEQARARRHRHRWRRWYGEPTREARRIVANQLGRDSISIELGPKYAAMGARRIQDDAGMLCDITIEEMP